MATWSALASVVFSYVIFSSTAYAVKSLDFTIHQEYTSTRALGMGNAFTAVADDQSAIFYNPAGLAFRKDGTIHAFLRAGIDDQILDLEKEIKKAKDAADPETAIADLVTSKYGEHYYMRVPTLGAMYVRPRWGFAFIPADLSVDVAVHQQVGPTLNVNGYLDSTLAMSYARPVHWLKNHDIAWGITLKGLHRVHVGQSLLAAQLVEGKDIFEKDDANEGMTFDADLGLMWKLAPTGFMRHLKPTFAFVVRNVADYGYPVQFGVISENAGKPPKLVRRFDLGSKFDLPKFWVFDPHLALDMRDMGHENWTIKKGFHVGAELYWTMYKWWKGHWAVGLNQGYWTAGIGLKLGAFQIDAASFGEEVGTSNASKESRRYMAELSLDF